MILKVANVYKSFYKIVDDEFEKKNKEFVKKLKSCLTDQKLAFRN